MNRRVRLIVRGHVQGVGFRHFVWKRALELGLDGEVRNLSGGTVEVIASGAPEAIEILIVRLREGPLAARVSDIGIEWEDLPGLARGFRIRS